MNDRCSAKIHQKVAKNTKRTIPFLNINPRQVRAGQRELSNPQKPDRNEK
jgi:hypothetical protein